MTAVPLLNKIGRIHPIHTHELSITAACFVAVSGTYTVFFVEPIISITA